MEIVIPSHTIVAHQVAVIVDDNITSTKRPLAEAFLRYLQSVPGQQIFYSYHQRSVSHYREELPTLYQPFTVEELGGWMQAYDDLILLLWQKEIELDLVLQDISTILEPGE